MLTWNRRLSSAAFVRAAAHAGECAQRVAARALSPWPALELGARGPKLRIHFLPLRGTRALRRHDAAAALPLAADARAGRARRRRSEWRVVRLLLPYLWEFKARVVVALAFLVGAKLTNVAVPLLLKQVVDSLDPQTAVLAVPLALLAAYGLLRFSTTLFAELRDVVFVRVAQRAVRRVALEVFRHLHSLSLALPSRAPDRRRVARHRARARAASRPCSRTCCSRSSR